MKTTTSSKKVKMLNDEAIASILRDIGDADRISVQNGELWTQRAPGTDWQFRGAVNENEADALIAAHFGG